MAATKCPSIKLVWADRGYNGKCKRAIEEELGLNVEIKTHLADRSRGVWTTGDKRPEPITKGFRVIERRWVVERTFAWQDGYRRHSKNYDELAEITEAWHWLAGISRLVRRLAVSAEAA